MATNVSLAELMKVLEKSGAKFGDSAAMKSGLPFLKEDVKSQVQQNSPLSAKKRNYEQQLARVAEMDKKLSGVYGNTSSNLYIEHAGQREKAVGGAVDTEFDALKGVGDEIKDTQKDIDDQTKEALDLYKELTKEQADLEKESKKAGTKKKSQINKAQKEIDAERKRLGLDIADKARITDPEAVDIFLNAPTKFQEQWQRKLNTNPTVFSQGGFTKEEVQKELEKWEVQTKGKKARTSLFK